MLSPEEIALWIMFGFIIGFPIVLGLALLGNAIINKITHKKVQ